MKLAFPLFGFWFYLICRNILLVAWGIVFFWKFDILKIQNPKELSICIFSLRDFFQASSKGCSWKYRTCFFSNCFLVSIFLFLSILLKYFRLIFYLKIKKKYQNFIHNTFEIKIFSTKLLFYIIRLFFQKFWAIFQKIKKEFHLNSKSAENCLI